mmetsp:Transcript_93831/g.148212  ORF Transcript_93831/g.148212 Transcript_93831/m.148212 type:complete len:206 (+) Transcript_93831:516-1133(+)
MGVYTCISCRSCEILTLSVGDVLLSLRISVLLGKAKIDDMDLVCLLSQTNQKVVRLNVAVDEILRVHILNAVHCLVSEHQHRLQTKLAVAKAEEILERGAEKIENHNIVVAFHSIPMDVWHANATCQNLVQLGLVQQLWVLRFDGLQFDGNLVTSLYICANVNISKRSGANLTSQSELAADSQLHCKCKSTCGCDGEDGPFSSQT